MKPQLQRGEHAVTEIEKKDAVAYDRPYIYVTQKGWLIAHYTSAKVLTFFLKITNVFN